jgi:hypothetical protein
LQLGEQAGPELEDGMNDNEEEERKTGSQAGEMWVIDEWR